MLVTDRLGGDINRDDRTIFLSANRHELLGWLRWHFALFFDLEQGPAARCVRLDDTDGLRFCVTVNCFGAGVPIRQAQPRSVCLASYLSRSPQVLCRTARLKNFVVLIFSWLVGLCLSFNSFQSFLRSALCFRCRALNSGRGRDSPKCGRMCFKDDQARVFGEASKCRHHKLQMMRLPKEGTSS
jgi:hypothetical protein